MTLLVERSASTARDRQENQRVSQEALSLRPAGDTPLRVLFLIDHLGGLGGGETSLVRMVRMFPPDRVQCHVVTLDARVNSHLEKQLSCPLHVIPIRSVYGLHAFAAAARFRRLLRYNKIDVVHTFFESANLWGGMVTKFGGGPILVSSRRDMNILRVGARHRAGYALVNRLCDRVVTVSDAVRDLCIREERLPPDKVVTLYNGVDLDPIASVTPDWQLRERHGFSMADPIITSVANIRRVKGLDTLVRTASIVCREVPGARFLIVGGENEAEYGQELRRSITALGLERNVVFHGLSENVVSILKASQIFCLFSRSEGFSSALLEAMACSLPCVVTRVGGNPEAVVEGQTGYVIDPEDYQAAADRILTLLHDPQRRSVMGDAGYNVILSNFTARKMVSDLADFYEQLVLENARR